LPDWIYLIFVFASGCCIGSFLNVVIYRLSREQSIITPPSACPACGKKIKFYDNIPLVSWIILKGRCRNCKARISGRYFVVELLTGTSFAFLFAFYFHFEGVSGLESFLEGGWIVFLAHILLIAALMASSVIDLQLWVIPLSICLFAIGGGVCLSALGVYVMDFEILTGYHLLPSASVKTAALAAGAGIGLIISVLLTSLGLVKRSYEQQDINPDYKNKPPQWNHRVEIAKEVLFLLPVLFCAFGAYVLAQNTTSFRSWWVNFSQYPPAAGALGSLWGAFLGAAVVWATRIIGTIIFGKEAMGLGDVYLMSAAGAILGPLPVMVAFFIAPFFGLAWAASQMFSKKISQIPYGPFLSLALFLVMLVHDNIYSYYNFIRFHR